MLRKIGYLLAWILGGTMSVWGQVADTLPYQPSVTKHYDLVHTTLQLSFDWSNQTVNGEAKLLVRPYFYDQKELVLQARGFDLGTVLIKTPNGYVTPQYTYNQRTLTLSFENSLTRLDTAEVIIRYKVTPHLLERLDGEEVRPEKGLYFINPTGDKKNKPRQLWTQGETHWNSNWFPTLDAPNVKFTHDFYLTVADSLTTISNGTLVSQVLNRDGTRTDHWQQQLPHAPYLAMIAVGNFAIVRDTSATGLPLAYYIEPAYKEDAKAIFGRTPAMLDFFENRFGVRYPWANYKQVIVRDFVSGAMENTTASVFEESALRTRRELIDENSDGVIAHELAHHWFGNLVTCESWANLPLNEAFANYAEYLWAEHAYGVQQADYLGSIELNNYLAESRQKKVPLIRYYHSNPEDMFDSHSYAKGGRILHMLRGYVGDDAFFTALKLYLTKHQYQTAELADLRIAFEEVTGWDLKTFFDQWFYKPGHPVLKVQHGLVDDGKVLQIQIEQVQEDSSMTYRFPLSISYWDGGKKVIQKMHLNQKSQVFKFPVVSSIQALVIDEQNYLVGEIQLEYTEQEALYLLKNATTYKARAAALDALDVYDSAEKWSALEVLLNDDFWRFRQLAIVKLASRDDKQRNTKLRQRWTDLAKKDPKSAVRQEAVRALGSLRDKQYKLLFREALQDSSYWVNAAALTSLIELSPKEAMEIIKPYQDIMNVDIQQVVFDVWSKEKQAKLLPQFVDRLERQSAVNKYRLLPAFGSYLIRADADTQMQSVPYLTELALKNDSYIVRYGAYQLLDWLRDLSTVPKVLNQIVSTEQDPRLLKLYKEMEK